MADCHRWIGNDCEDVNRWIDEYFAILGANHRKVRHHREGVDEAAKIFGERGRAAAQIHILRDCRHIPRQADYETGAVDRLGLKSFWPVSAYIQFPEEAFDALVNYTLNGPSGKLLWAFVDTPEDAQRALSATTTFTPQQQAEVFGRWHEANAIRVGLPRLTANANAVGEGDEAARAYIQRWSNTNLFALFRQMFGPDLRIVFLAVDVLINPLLIIDNLFLAEIRPALRDASDLASTAFALPEAFETPIKAAADPQMKTVNFIDSQKTAAVSPLQMTVLPGIGVQVTFIVSGTPQIIMVDQVGDRFYLRSGIHRAYLLATLGRKYIPVLLTQQKQVPNTTGVYPTYTAETLARPRPPMLLDAMDERLTIDVPIQRTQKIIRISAEELVLPVS